MTLTSNWDSYPKSSSFWHLFYDGKYMYVRVDPDKHLVAAPTTWLANCRRIIAL